MPTKQTRLDDLFTKAVALKASDIHLLTEVPPMVRIDGELAPIKGEKVLEQKELEGMIEALLNEKQVEIWHRERELDSSYELPDETRLRVNVYWEKDHPALVARIIPSVLPKMEDLGAPQVLFQMAELNQGLVLVTGPTGCGKSTTLAAMINYINQTRSENIVTLEDPIEFVYRAKLSLISQRQLGTDMESFAEGLKHVLRQDPNVIMVGEMRDVDTIATTITLAETGHLVFATLHTNSSAQTIDRIIDVFPPNQQNQIRMQLSFVLRGIVSQVLLPKAGGGRVAAREVLVHTPAIANLIRENKIAQIPNYLQTNKEWGMHTLDQDLKRLLDEGQIDKETAQFYAHSQKEME